MAEDQRYSLRWNDFAPNVAAAFRALKDSEDFVDVTLACDGKALKAHKVILSASSPFFRHLLKENPCQHPIVILKDVRYQEMESLLNFMYHGEVQISQEDLNEFLRTAHSLQVKGLADVPHQFPNQPPSPAPSISSLHIPEVRMSENESDSLPGPPNGPKAESDGEKQQVESNRKGSDAHSDDEGLFNHRPDKKRRHEDDDEEADDEGEHERGRRKTSRSSILIQALQGDQHRNSDDCKHEVIEDDSSPDEGEKYEDKDGSSDELSAHALSEAIRFPAAAALLGFQGLPGFLPGPSSGNNASNDNGNFVSRRGMEMLRVRATDPRPCPKCGKIYRSAHTLRTHLEDKHTVCPGYRCVLCGTVAKSRNSLHSHMSRQHRGISTKDLPVLPMPAPFDPQLAARLLAKAGLKFPDIPNSAGGSPNQTGNRRDSSGEKVDVSPGGRNSDGGTTGSAILDTYLQFIAENSMGPGGQMAFNKRGNNSGEESEEDP